jgi:hypothetical protein
MFWAFAPLSIHPRIRSLFAGRGNKKRKFRYWYLPHPFASANEKKYFTVEAANQEEANALAIARIPDLIRTGETVFNEIHPC